MYYCLALLKRGSYALREEKKKNITIGSTEILTMAMDQKNPSTMYVGAQGGGVYVSVNGGETWRALLALKDTPRAIAVHPKNPQIVFIATEQRVLVTRDGGATWDIMYIETRPNVRMSDLAIDGFDPQKVYLGLSQGDVMRSVNGGTSWSLLYQAKSAVLRIIVHPKDTRIITVMTQNDGLFRTTNLGADWESLLPFMGNYSDTARGHALITNPQNPQHLLYIAYGGLLATDDGGKVWKPIQLLGSPSATPVTAFALAPQKPQHLFYTTATTLYRSRDNGKTWTTLLLPTTKRPSVLLAHPKNPAMLFMGIRSQKK